MKAVVTRRAASQLPQRIPGIHAAAQAIGRPGLSPHRLEATASRRKQVDFELQSKLTLRFKATGPQLSSPRERPWLAQIGAGQTEDTKRGTKEDEEAAHDGRGHDGPEHRS